MWANVLNISCIYLIDAKNWQLKCSYFERGADNSKDNKILNITFIRNFFVEKRTEKGRQETGKINKKYIDTYMHYCNAVDCPC